jgi:hypothetical protein
LEKILLSLCYFSSLFSKRLEHLGDALFLLLHVWVNIEIKGCCDVGMTEQYTYSLVVKDGILKEHSVRRHVRKNGSISYDVYSLELVIAVAFRIDSIESRAIREFITARSKLSTIRLRWFTTWFIHSLFLVITSLLIVVSVYC